MGADEADADRLTGMVLPEPEALTDEAAAHAAALAFGRWLFAQECTFVNGSTTLETLPPDTLPEIAFAGRSNVGKSSLINALTGRKTLARTSHTPGRTQQINFFDLGGRLMLVDLPGYGYADAPKSEIRRWTELVETYLKGRQRLRRVCLLIDGRHGLKKVDEPVMKMLDQAAVSYQIVLTKTDKLRAAELPRRVGETTEGSARHVAAHPTIRPTSAHEAYGLEELRAELAAFAEPPAPQLRDAR